MMTQFNSNFSFEVIFPLPNKPKNLDVSRFFYLTARLIKCRYFDHILYYIHIDNTTFKLSVFWPSDTESRINELRFSDSVPLSFKTRLTSITCFCGGVIY